MSQPAPRPAPSEPAAPASPSERRPFAAHDADPPPRRDEPPKGFFRRLASLFSLDPRSGGR